MPPRLGASAIFLPNLRYPMRESRASRLARPSLLTSLAVSPLFGSPSFDSCTFCSAHGRRCVKCIISSSTQYMVLWEVDAKSLTTGTSGALRSYHARLESLPRPSTAPAAGRPFLPRFDQHGRLTFISTRQTPSPRTRYTLAAGSKYPNPIRPSASESETSRPCPSTTMIAAPGPLPIASRRGSTSRRRPLDLAMHP